MQCVSTAAYFPLPFALVKSEQFGWSLRALLIAAILAVLHEEIYCCWRWWCCFRFSRTRHSKINRQMCINLYRDTYFAQQNLSVETDKFYENGVKTSTHPVHSRLWSREPPPGPLNFYEPTFSLLIENSPTGVQTLTLTWRHPGLFTQNRSFRVPANYIETVGYNQRARNNVF